MEKICATCKVLLDVSLFSKHKDNKDGLQYSCKLCQKNRLKDYGCQGTKVSPTYDPCSTETYEKLKAILVTINFRRFLELMTPTRRGVVQDRSVRIA